MTFVLDHQSIPTATGRVMGPHETADFLDSILTTLEVVTRPLRSSLPSKARRELDRLRHELLEEHAVALAASRPEP